MNDHKGSFLVSLELLNIGTEMLHGYLLLLVHWAPASSVESECTLWFQYFIRIQTLFCCFSRLR